ncbi:MAG: hypothetical protein DLM70_19050 [Chloroflexi bacterium]|nr:MAG: hypothetical protein DLM70_19050 [Chloroflexota bacterium]
MRIEASVTSISWIPFASIEGLTKIPFEMGICKYDDPPRQTLRDFKRNQIEQGEVGPGAILGERAYLEGGRRKATLRASTTCRVALASPDVFPREALEEPALQHGRRPRTVTPAHR